MTQIAKRLIEVAIPIREISSESVRVKSIVQENAKGKPIQQELGL
jgi:hypothetical protein